MVITEFIEQSIIATDGAMRELEQDYYEFFPEELEK